MKSPRSPAARRQMNMRLDRHSGTGTRGLPKKNGAGGKTVWGASIDQDPVSYIDKNDPNYDPETDEAGPPDLSLSTNAPSTEAKNAAESQGQGASPAKDVQTPESTG